MKYIAFTFVFVALSLCSCCNNKAANEREQGEVSFDSVEREQSRPKVKTDVAQISDVQTEDTLRAITEKMAYEGVNNYCHSAYDWSVAKDNPDIMYITMGEDTDSAYQVIFRSYTGAFVHFYVNKASGITRMIEKVPSLNVEEDAGTINLFDYLEKQK
jgi:hypothetical protein